MIKKFALTIFMFACVLPVQTSAQTAATIEKQNAIKELIAFIGFNSNFEETIKAMSAQMQTMEEATVKAVLDERTDLTAADRKEIENTLLNERSKKSWRFQDKLMQKLDYSKLMDEIAFTIYDKYYTLEEIRDLTAFFRTPTGQKSLKLATPMTTDTMQLIQERLLLKLPAVIKEIQDEEQLEIEQKINARKPKPKKKAGA